MAGEPTLPRFAFALVLAACILVAHIDHRGLVDLLARIGGTPTRAVLLEHVEEAGAGQWAAGPHIPEDVLMWTIEHANGDEPSLVDAPPDVREWFNENFHWLVEFFGTRRALDMHDELPANRPGRLSRVKTAVIACVRKAHEQCDPLDEGPWRAEPALDLEHAIRRPWLLLGYVLHWHWAWNAVCWAMHPTVGWCAIKHADAALLLACYAYMARAVWMWRKPPPRTIVAPVAKKDD